MQLHGLPASTIRFPTHDGRGGFTLALSSHQSSDRESLGSRHTAIIQQSLKTPSSFKARSTHASTSSSILDDALPRQPHPSSDLSQRIYAWAREQQLYARLRHNKRRRLSAVTDQRIRRDGFEGWLWRFVSHLIGMDDHLLQIVLGEETVETSERSSFTDLPTSVSFWDGLLHRTAFEQHVASPFLSPQFQQVFRTHFYHDIPLSSSTPMPTSTPRPTRPAPSPWPEASNRQLTSPHPGSSWSSVPPDPIQIAPFQPTPVLLHTTTQHRPESSHAPWGIEENDILSTSASEYLSDDYWDRELTIPLVWHIVKNFISSRLSGSPSRSRQQSEDLPASGIPRSCKEESAMGSRWEDRVSLEDRAGYYWHESVDGASSLALGLGGHQGHWAEV